MIASFIGLYLKLNLLLALSYLILRATRCLQLRWAQFLLLSSLILPVGLHFLPLGQLPKMPESIRAPISEVTGTLSPNRRAAKTARGKEGTASPATEIKPYFYSPITLSEALIAFLFLGFVVAAGRMFLLTRRLSGLLRNSTVMKRAGRVIVVVSPEIAVPFSTLVGARAWVALPESLLSNWTDFKLAVKHEIQHHRQRDTLWAIGIELLVVIFYPNPAIYLWKKRIHEFQELSCDEALIGRKVSSYDYGSCLVRVAEAALGSRQVLAGTAGMAAGSENPVYFKSFLRRRIEMLTRPRNQSRMASTFVGTLSLLFAATVACGAEVVSDHRETSTVTPGIAATDPAIQAIADTAIKAAVKRHRAGMGFIIVSDPMSGRLLAVANQDTLAERDEKIPHWALSLRLGPASIAKVITAVAAVERGVTSFSQVHDCENGNFDWGGHHYEDWKPFLKLTTAETIVHSSNICGIKVGQKLGVTGIMQAFQDFGFGPGGTAEGFPEARPGEILDPSQVSDSFYVATSSTGYGGIYLSPLELVQAIGAIGNGGNLLKPQSSASNSVTPKIVRRVVSEDTARKTREVLADVMIHGTARNAASRLYRLGGKTATALGHSHPAHDQIGGDSNMAAFVGLAPIDNPRLVIFVVIENPTDQKGVHGATQAAPVFREVAEKALQHLGVPPSPSR